MTPHEIGVMIVAAWGLAIALTVAGAWRVYDDAGRVLHDDGHAYADGLGGFCYAVEVVTCA